MKPKISFVIAALLFCIGLLRAPIALPPASINGCQNITSSGSYSLGTNLVGANITADNPPTTACILISTSDVTVNCTGYSIINNVTGDTTGILMDGSTGSKLTNVTIENCQVSNYTSGVYTYYTNNSIILNNTARNNTNGFVIYYGTDNSSFMRDTAYGNTVDGFSITDDTGSNNVFINDTAYSNYNDGFELRVGKENILINGTAYNNSADGFSINIASDHIAIENSTAYSNNGSGFAIYSELGVNNLTVNTAYNNSIGFTISSSDLNNLSSNTAYNNSLGFYLSIGTDSTLTGNTARNNTWGFVLNMGYENNLTSNIAYGNYWHGFLAEDGTFTNNFVNDTSYSNQYEGFYIADAHNNNIINSTAYGNHEDGFLIGNGSSYNLLENNTSHNNTIRGFEVDYSNYNALDSNIAYNNTQIGYELYFSNYTNLTNNVYNQTPWSGQYRYDAFELDNSSYNNLINNTEFNAYDAGFYLYGSNNNSLINNTARNTSWDGFVVDSSFDNYLTNNSAYNSGQFGLDVYKSAGNNITDNLMQESSYFDLYTDSLSWSFGLNITMADPTFCNNIIENLTGSGGRPINYSNASVNWDGITSSEIVLCNAGYSNLTNIIVHGSDSINNNGVVITTTNHALIENTSSSNNFIGFVSIYSSNDNFTGDTADGDFLAGFVNLIGLSNKFISNMQSGSFEAGFIDISSLSSVYYNNTAHDNQFAGIAIENQIEFIGALEDPGTMAVAFTVLANNTVYNSSQVGTTVDSPFPVIILGDHYYHNSVDFAMDNTGMIGPVSLSFGNNKSVTSLPTLLEFKNLAGYGTGSLPHTSVPFFNTINLSGVIFDDPLGNYVQYTNLSLNDVVEPNESYTISWSEKPYVGDPYSMRSFHGKFINITAAPNATIDTLIWQWTADEAAGHNESLFVIMQYNNNEWRGAPAQMTINPGEHSLSLSNLGSFGIFGPYEPGPPPQQSGGSGCSSLFRASVEHTICPDNTVVLLFSDVSGNPAGAGQLVTLSSSGWLANAHTNSSGEVSFTLPSSGQYTIGGVFCGYSFNYEMCKAGCSSNNDCGDGLYCDSSGTCRPVTCQCGQIYNHSCRSYQCCADSDCAVNYACVNHACQAPVVQPECTTDSNCSDVQYCSNGKCTAVQAGRCGYVANHMWNSYQCCNDSDCQQGYACINNSCTLYRIITDPSGYVGDQHEAYVLPAGQYTLSVITPAGETKTISTDSKGHTAFTLDNAGVYSLSLVNGKAAANVSVNALVKSTPASTAAVTSPSLPGWCIPGAVIGIILLLAIIYLLYRRR